MSFISDNINKWFYCNENIHSVIVSYFKSEKIEVKTQFIWLFANLMSNNETFKKLFLETDILKDSVTILNTTSKIESKDISIEILNFRETLGFLLCNLVFKISFAFKV